MRLHRNGRRGGRPNPHARADSAFASASNHIPDDDNTYDEPASADSAADFFRRSANAKADQKARQLCRQVYRTLSVALAGCGDDVLQDLTVVAVDPAPDAGHLLVTVSAAATPAGGSGDGTAPSAGPAARAGTLPDVLDRLGRATGRLRSEVARDIVRKRAPSLAFRVLPRGEVTR